MIDHVVYPFMDTAEGFKQKFTSLFYFSVELLV